MTILLVAFGLLFALLAAWAWWYLREMGGACSARREAGDRAAEKARAPKGAKRAQPLRVKICERQIYRRDSPRAVAAGSRIDPLRAGLRRAQTS